MNLKRIESFSRYEEIVERYGRKGCSSNDYIQLEAADLIIRGKLYEICGEDNAFVLVRKEGFSRVYYYLNDMREKLDIEDEALVTEILFRGNNGEPINEINYLSSCGFKRNVVRDLYELRYKNFSIEPYILPDDVVIRHVKTHEEAMFCIQLFNSVFDRFSGDYISNGEIETMITNRQLYVAFLDNDPAGALHVSKGANNLFWMNHLAVCPEARGNHIATGLCFRFIEDSYQNESTRFSLWTQRQNHGAIRMYEKLGFKYVGKSTLSMIKQV